MSILENKKAQWFEQFLNSTNIGVLIANKDRNNLFVNKYTCDLSGYSEDELVGTSSEIFHVNHEAFVKFSELAFDLVIQGKPVKIDYQFKKKDGTLVWAHVTGDIVEGEEEVLWSMVDITKSVKEKKQAKVLSQRMELALLGNNAGVYEWYMLDNTAYYSSQWMHMLGYKDNELPPYLSTWQDRVHPDDIEEVMLNVQKSIEAKKNAYRNSTSIEA